MHVFVCIWGSNRYLMKVKFGLAMAAESGGKMDIIIESLINHTAQKMDA